MQEYGLLVQRVTLLNRNHFSLFIVAEVDLLHLFAHLLELDSIYRHITSLESANSLFPETAFRDVWAENIPTLVVARFHRLNHLKLRYSARTLLLGEHVALSLVQPLLQACLRLLHRIFGPWRKVGSVGPVGLIGASSAIPRLVSPRKATVDHNVAWLWLAWRHRHVVLHAQAHFIEENFLLNFYRGL